LDEVPPERVRDAQSPLVTTIETFMADLSRFSPFVQICTISRHRRAGTAFARESGGD
jgi:hypothetical protein